MTTTSSSSPRAIAPAPELLEALTRVSGGHLTPQAGAKLLLDAVDRHLWEGASVEQAKDVGEALALRSLGQGGGQPTDASPHETPGAPQGRLLEEKFSVTASEIPHPRRVLGASSFLASLLSQDIPPGLKDGAERLIAHLKETYPVESGIRDLNATQW